ncbi:hypothetical protein [Streptomyces mexicanus]|uniref:Uncharacterized protein n=1 Tax=Streptomyces mexicanus TaxID=178566 RepID=A0A7X1I6V7_9ACTN|nr:hypothetical protein [Streptomyces mexicanus]MBC2869836.1 hypothetical protein [Streptomyces mexicanus]
MTAMHLNSADGHGHGRALRARRCTTRVLRLVGDHISTVAVGVVGAGALAWMINHVTEFAPVLNITDNMAILLILATWGTAHLVKGFAYDVADGIDPDARDGDDLWKAATAFRDTAEDITNGANYDDIRLALQTSQVLPALHELTVHLRGAYALDGEMEEAAALSDTVALVRVAAESLGHRDLSE